MYYDMEPNRCIKIVNAYIKIRSQGTKVSNACIKI